MSHLTISTFLQIKLKFMDSKSNLFLAKRKLGINLVLRGMLSTTHVNTHFPTHFFY